MRLGRAAAGSLAVVVVAGAAAAGLTSTPARHAAASPGQAYVRVNQVGFATGAPKRALLMASGSEAGATYDVISGTKVVAHAPIGPSLGSWSPTFPDVYAIDLSALHAAGDYTVVVSGPIPARSPTVHVGSGASLYQPLLSNALAYYQSVRDGSDVVPSVLHRKPSHLTDHAATVYATPTLTHGIPSQPQPIAGPVDVEGGWFDAGDYLKFVETTSYVDGVMLYAERDLGTRFPGGPAALATEAAVGEQWLSKMWDDSSATLHLQVGLGSAPAGYVGDHDIWRLPEADDALSVTPSDPLYFIKYRPVFDAAPPGQPISPNLAGRLAADFGLCAQELAVRDPRTAKQCLRSGEHVYALANTHDPGPLVTTVPRAFYPETAWRDDMEWGAAELARALQLDGSEPALAGEAAGLPHVDASFYLGQAAQWAQAYIASQSGDADSLNLYDTSALAHVELIGALDAAGDPAGLAIGRAGLLADLHRQLAIAQRQSATDPFGLGVAYAGPDATPHALGIAVTEARYEALSGDHSFHLLAQHQLDWLLGANAWGTSFIIGAGTVFPHCPQSQIANLAGSLDGSPPVQLGAVGDGPSARSNLSGLGLPAHARRCPPDGSDPFRPFNGKGARYLDDARSWPTVEPSLDYTVLTLVAFADQAA